MTENDVGRFRQYLQNEKVEWVKEFIMYDTHTPAHPAARHAEHDTSANDVFHLFL
jgi:hypothetical protein